MAPSNSVQTDGRRKGPARLEEAISNPGAVKINVTGAFIVDDEPRSRSPIEADGVHYENKDIRLPHHTGVVSHVAVDVSWEFPLSPSPLEELCWCPAPRPIISPQFHRRSSCKTKGPKKGNPDTRANADLVD